MGFAGLPRRGLRLGSISYACSRRLAASVSNVLACSIRFAARSPLPGTSPIAGAVCTGSATGSATGAGATYSWEENDFRRWGYDIDGGYTIANRKFKPHGTSAWNDALQYILDCFGFEQPGVVKLDVQMPGQCFYWHLDAFGGVLKSHRGDFDAHSASDLDQRKTMRTMIFLDDQHLGQMWQQGNLLLEWQRGDCITWPWRDIPHGTCNYGHTPRPVLNITGTLTDKTWEFLHGL